MKPLPLLLLSFLSLLVLGTAARAASDPGHVTFLNPGMEAGDSIPAGWTGRFGHCAVSRDTAVFHKGKASLLVDRGGGTDSGRGCAHQLLRLPSVTKVKIGGWVKTEGAARAILAAHFFDERFGMSELVPVGELTTASDWQHAEAEVTVPAGSVRMAIALYVEGQGKAWLDDVSLDLPGSEVKVKIASPMDSPPPEVPADGSKIPTTPVPGFYPDQPAAWMQFHEANVRRVKEGDIEVVFLGDSITQGWTSVGREAWEKNFAPLKAVNFGLGGDKTSNILWRLNHGTLDGIKPRVVVLMVGLNNLWSGESSGEAIVDGIRANVEKIKSKAPDAKILVLGVLPIGPDPAGLDRARAAYINRLASGIGDGAGVRFVDVSEKFVSGKGGLTEGLYAADSVHLTAKGYEVLAKEVLPWVTELSKPPGSPEGAAPAAPAAPKKKTE